MQVRNPLFHSIRSIRGTGQGVLDAPNDASRLESA
jgi:hypothetical protein